MNIFLNYGFSGTAALFYFTLSPRSVLTAFIRRLEDTGLVLRTPKIDSTEKLCICGNLSVLQTDGTRGIGCVFTARYNFTALVL